jgi:4-amino-4-deoxy-L-arabinose transferase-like glycosyltransferase
MSVDTRNLLLCVLVTLLAILVAWPFAEGGYIDDFSYIHMSKTLAETGRFAYNGWPTAMLGIQVWWGAAWIWLFGFSFTLVRLSVLPLALGAVALVYLIARRASLSPSDSLFAALLTGLNPRFMVLAPSFMTDVSALFFLMASLYGFVRAVETASQVPARTRDTLAWLALGMLCGMLGGTIRQTVWFAPLAGAAVLFIWPGVDLRSRLVAILCGVTGLACIVVSIRWFNSQPYAIPTRSLSGMAVGLSEFGTLVRTMAWVVVGSMSAMLPVFVYRFAALRLWRRDRMAWLSNSLTTDAIIVAALVLVFFPATVAEALELAAISTGMTPVIERGVWMLRGLRIGLMLLLALAAVAMVVQWRGAIMSAARRIPAAIVVPLVYLLPYSAAVMQASQTTGGLFDRYYLPCVPLLACALLYCIGATATSAADRRSAFWGWVFIAIIAVPEVMRLHDVFADCRARLAALAHLEGQGVARDRIMAGWQIDGWEQIERAGHLNDLRIRVPPDAYKPFQPDGYPEQLMLRDRMSALTPEYIVTDDPTPFPGDGTKFPTFPYTSWRPPFHREIVICHQTRTQADKKP